MRENSKFTGNKLNRHGTEAFLDDIMSGPAAGTRLFQGPFFHLHYPVSWEAEIIEDIPAFYDPEGGGVLQIAAWINPDRDAGAEQELQNYLDRQEINMPGDKIALYMRSDGSQCAVCEFMVDGRFWLCQSLCMDKQAMLILYNSDEIPDEVQIRLISNAIQSVQFSAGQ